MSENGLFGDPVCPQDSQSGPAVDRNFNTPVAQATVDPHLTGFDGTKFDFHGEPDKFYNLISDKDLQVNSYFRHWATSGANNFTVMEKMGIMFDGHRIEIDRDYVVKINDEEVNEFPVFLPKGRINKFDKAPEKFMHLNGHPEVGQLLGGYLVFKHPYLIYLIVSTDNYNPPCLNLFVESRDTTVRPHGVVGQTMEPKERKPLGNQGEGVIEGVYTDYEVSDLWSTDFAFNRFLEEVYH